MLDHLPTLLIKNRNRSSLMRMLRIEETGQVILLPKGVYVGYNTYSGQSARIYIHWHGKGYSKYSYNHQTPGGLLNIYTEVITSAVSQSKSGLFDDDGMVELNSSKVKAHWTDVFRVYDTELEAVYAMSDLLFGSRHELNNVQRILQTQWVNLKELRA